MIETDTGGNHAATADAGGCCVAVKNRVSLAAARPGALRSTGSVTETTTLNDIQRWQAKAWTLNFLSVIDRLGVADG